MSNGEKRIADHALLQMGIAQAFPQYQQARCCGFEVMLRSGKLASLSPTMELIATLSNGQKINAQLETTVEQKPFQVTGSDSLRKLYYSNFKQARSRLAFSWEQTPLLSVFVPLYPNTSGASLLACLEGLRAQQATPIEVLLFFTKISNEVSEFLNKDNRCSACSML